MHKLLVSESLAGNKVSHDQPYQDVTEGPGHSGATEDLCMPIKISSIKFIIGYNIIGACAADITPPRENKVSE